MKGFLSTTWKVVSKSEGCKSCVQLKRNGTHEFNATSAALKALEMASSALKTASESVEKTEAGSQAQRQVIFEHRATRSGCICGH